MRVCPNDDTGLWEIHDGRSFVTAIESESNAYTFAAAHDMLDALDAVVDEKSLLSKSGTYITIILTREEYARAKQAVKKARKNLEDKDDPAANAP